MDDNIIKVKTFKIINQDSLIQWTKFVDSHMNGNIFQTPKMFQVYYDTENYFPFVHIAYRKDTVCGILAGVIQKEYRGFLGFLTSRCIIHGGPLTSDNNSNIIDRLLFEHNKFIKRKAIYSQVRNLYDLKDKKQVFNKNGFNYEPHLNIHINLKDSFDDLKKQIHKSRIRNYTKSINKGSSVRFLNDVEDIKIGYKLIKETYQRVKLPLPAISHFSSLFNALYPRGMCQCLGLFFADEMIGFRVLLTYKGVIFDYYAGNSQEHSNKYPNDVLIMNILEWGCDSKYEYFDFGGAGKPDATYGVRDYKMKFCNKLIEPGRFVRVYYPLFFIIIKILFRFWQRVKR